MNLLGIVEWFERFRWWRSWLVVVALLMTYWAWDKRGALVGVIGAAVYGFLFGFRVFRPEATAAWALRHPALDGAFVVPLGFLAIAMLSSWPLLVCAGCGLAAWAVPVLIAGSIRVVRAP